MSEQQTNPEVDTSTEINDELDNWFDDEEEEEEDQSATDELSPEGDTSPPEGDEESVPDPQVQESDAGPEGNALEDGTSPDPAAQEDPYSWVSELDPALRDKVEALVHRDQSNMGRVAALQSRLDRMSAEQEAQQSIQPQAAAPKGAVAEGKAIEDMDDEELKFFMEEYPSVAQNVQKLIEQRVAKEREEILGHVRPIEKDIRAEQYLKRKETLRQEAARIFNTGETGIQLEEVLTSPQWNNWLAQQPPGYQSFVKNTNSVEDAVKALEDFAIYADAQVRASLEGQQEPTSPEEPPITDADRTAARRREALQGSSPESRSAELADSGMTDSYEGYFDEACAKDG